MRPPASRPRSLEALIRIGLCAALPLAATGCHGRAVAASNPEAAGDWPVVGKDYQNRRFSELEQIATGNVSRLKVAWTFSTGIPRGHEGAPLIVGDRAHSEMIETDADEAQWEEMESDLRNHGRLSPNYLVLMALGGLIAACGFVLDPVSQAIAFVGASIIAPGFEPVAKLAQGLVVGARRLCGHALLSIVVGYAVLFAAALLMMTILGLIHPGHPHQLVMRQPILTVFAGFAVAPLATTAAAAIAGVMMVVSLRDLYVVGPLMVLVAVPGVALAGTAVAIGEPALALRVLSRVGLDLLLIVVLGGGVFYWKQRRFHRRRPLG